MYNLHQQPICADKLRCSPRKFNHTALTSSLPQLGSTGRARSAPHLSTRPQQITENRARHWPGRAKGRHGPNDTHTQRHGLHRQTFPASGLRARPRDSGFRSTACGRRPASEAASRSPSAAAPPPARTRQPLGHAGAGAAEPRIECHLPPGSNEPTPSGHPREKG